MSGMLSKKPWPDDSMSDYFVVNEVGTTLVDKLTGNVLSNQPKDNHWEYRPVGSVGVYEVLGKNGSLAVYCPVFEGIAYPKAYLYWPNVPNV